MSDKLIFTIVIDGSTHKIVNNWMEALVEWQQAKDRANYSGYLWCRPDNLNQNSLLAEYRTDATSGGGLKVGEKLHVDVSRWQNPFNS